MSLSVNSEIIVIGASAGGVETLMRTLAGFPAGLPAAVFVVCHLPPGIPPRLAAILGRDCALRVVTAEAAPIELGTVYVARPDRHLLIEGWRLRTSDGPKQNHTRPAIDPLFRSAALSHGPRVIGVILSGMLDDGVAGLVSIRDRKGLIVVQDPEDALYPDMPRNALAAVSADHIVPASRIGELVTKLVAQPRTVDVPPPDSALERQVAIDAGRHRERNAKGSIPSVYGCPDCGGVLWQNEDPRLPPFECRVGHSFTVGGLDGRQATVAEDALWAAIRALEERADLSRRMATRHRTRNHVDLATAEEHRARTHEEHAAQLRRLMGGVASDAT